MKTLTITSWASALSAIIALSASGSAAANAGALKPWIDASNSTRFVVVVPSDEERVQELAKALLSAGGALSARHPVPYVKAALEVGNVSAALDIARHQPAYNCNLTGQSGAGVLLDRPALMFPKLIDQEHLPPPRNCLKVRLYHIIAAHPAAAGRVDWVQEVISFPGSNESKSALLTSIAVTQARGGDYVGARATAAGHQRLSDEPEKTLEEPVAQAFIAVAMSDNGTLAAALNLAKRAAQQCSPSPWCSVGYHQDILAYAYARVAIEHVNRGDIDAAESVIELAAREFGDSAHWVNVARYKVATRHAEAGRAFEAVEAVHSITHAELNSVARKEVESMFAEGASVRATKS